MIYRNLKLLSPVFGNRYFCTKWNFLDVTLDDNNGIATVSMTRPPANALNYELMKELNQLMKYLESTKPKGMILGSSSDTIFSAGLDMAEIYRPDRERLTSFYKTFQDTSMSLYNSSFPTVALITGHAPAGGCLLALCCEYRIMVKNFTIGLNESRVGIPLQPWICSVSANVIGFKNAELALTTGKSFSTGEALQIGLIDEIGLNRVDAMKKASSFFALFEGVFSSVRLEIKRNHRMGVLELMERTRNKDLESIINSIMQPEFQNHLEGYLKRLKNKPDNLE